MSDISSSLGTDFYGGGSNNLQYEIMRKSHYKLDIQGIDSRIACQDVTFPRIELEPTEVFYYNDRIKLATKPNPGELTVEVLDFVGDTIVKQLWLWFTQVYDPVTRNMGYSSTYKRAGILSLFDPNGNLTRTWSLTGLWPKNSPTPSQAYSYEGGQEVVKVEMGFCVDTVTLTLG